jgi:hypothetical protein
MARSIIEATSVVAGAGLQVIDGGKAARDVLGRDTSRHKLTSQQQGFVNSILTGDNQSDAYRANYDTSRMSDKSVWELSSRLFANVKVGSRIEQGRAPAYSFGAD